jgi:hypothetical protein
MLRIIGVLICLLTCVDSDVWAQITKEFKVEEREGFDLVHLDFNIYKGTSTFQRKHGDHPIYIHTALDKVNILPSFYSEIKNKVLTTQLIHRNVESETLGKSLSYKLFSSTNENFDHTWNVGLSSNFLYDLNLYFGVGKANLDFSYLTVINCLIKTASADVKIVYSKKKPNPVKMDTLRITTNMGNIDGENINFSNAKDMIFETNYGALNLSFTEAMSETCTVQAFVGAGQVNIVLPAENQPYKIKINATALCRTHLPAHLKDIGNKTYVSKNFQEKGKNNLYLIIDCSVGSVHVK